MVFFFFYYGLWQISYVFSVIVFLYIYIFINYSCMGEFMERNVIRSYWMFTGTYDSFHLSLTLFLYNYERYNMARGDGHLDSFYPWSQVLVLLSWTRVSWFEKKILIKKYSMRNIIIMHRMSAECVKKITKQNKKRKKTRDPCLISW